METHCFQRFSNPAINDNVTHAVELEISPIKQILEFSFCPLLASKLAKHKQVHEKRPIWLAVLRNQEFSKD